MTVGWRAERITVSSRNSSQMRESTLTIGAPVLAQDQGHLPWEGVGAGPGPDHAPDQEGLGEGLYLGDLDLGDLAPGWAMMPQWRRPDSF